MGTHLSEAELKGEMCMHFHYYSNTVKVRKEELCITKQN